MPAKLFIGIIILSYIKSLISYILLLKFEFHRLLK
uniref:Uncharacterized protein n=1 Tax=Siphoviridae sp. ctiV651 TaxID=2827917 RepID=A0A8S5S4T6_9CAUD|nr:MAG TPA: hypothetical protein [Siphoviridae sp. ctiV651]